MANRRFASALFDGMRGMDRVWSAAGTVQAALDGELMERAGASGLRSLFIGFETLSGRNLRDCGKSHNLHADYEEAVARLRDLGVMINASFVFGMDDDEPGVFDRTVEWAIKQGVETATFHILTPYPDTPLHARMQREGRILTEDTDLYDTRHAVFQPARMSPQRLEEGYWRAYRDFYAWSSILRAAGAKETLRDQLRHLAYTGAWRKAEPVWDAIIRARMLGFVVPLMEGVMSIGRRSETAREVPVDQPSPALSNR
ncbi:MAG: radical SAM protein [Gemmatimonadota bacterium]|nr:radical SAM protein [Gemmatimonadota bacterium]